jgi:hypothetical protein
MVRTFTVTVIASALLWGWWVLATTYRQLGPRAERDAVPAPVALEKGADALEEWRERSGTYAGAELGAHRGLALVRADASSYCLQVSEGRDAYHREGPNGAATAGRCPAG